ncbi:MAG: hypothetical protein IKQ83_06875, partial [Lachnospiraceae bacterium]|nr:hypothetical protein [Lachnospiraceae bacterium]
FVSGVYIVILFIRDRKKSVKMTLSLGISGILAFAYLLMNKIKNGNPTGVARGTWWDDYRTLTIDLINSLVTEVFNAFSVEVPAVIANMSIVAKAGFLLAVMILLAVFIIICLKKLSFAKAVCLPPMVFVVTAAIYYVMFTMIRYRSSMDTFYFRFFAPATVLLIIGLIGLVLRRFDGNIFNLTAGAVIAVITVALLTGLIGNGRTLYRERDDKTYYDIITEVWNEAYSEIPEKSVILWNPMDFRSSWVRPDIYSGELLPDDTWDSLCSRYYGSESICMLRSDANVVVNEGGYDKSITDRFNDSLNKTDTNRDYVVIEVNE